MMFLIFAIVAAWLDGTVPESGECLATTKDVQTDWSHATKVFAADVRAVEESGRLVTFEVVEAFKGVSRGRLKLWVDLEVHGFGFQVGQSVLVYGRPSPLDPEVMSTSCSPTRSITFDDQELLILRRLAQK